MNNTCQPDTPVHTIAPSRRTFLLHGRNLCATALLLAGCGRTPTSGTEALPAAELPLGSGDGVEAAGETSTSDATDASIAPSVRLLSIATVELPDTLDPALVSIIEAYPICYALYDGLIWLDRDLTPQPQLAETWERSADGLTWTFHLRQEVFFHHGSLFTAQDVVHTFNRILDPAVGSVMTPLFGFLATIEAVDERTVRFHLAQPNGDFLQLLSMPQMRILPHDYTDDQLRSHPSGTGPFHILQVEFGRRIVLVRNPDYWVADQILLDEVHYIRIPAFDAQIAALEEGEIDLVLDINIAYLSRLQENESISVVEAPSGRYQCLTMRVHEPPFNDLRIRQAIKHCIDRELLHRTLLQGHGKLGYDHPIPPSHPSWADISPLRYDVERARALLTEAGYGDGLTLQLVTAAAAPGMVALAEAIQEMAAPAGIQIEVIVAQVSAEIYFNEYWGRVPFYVDAWEYRPSLYETFAVAYRTDSPWNGSGWSDPAMDALLEEAAAASDTAAQRELYRAVQELMIVNGAVIIPYFLPILTAMRRRVQGFVPHPAGWIDFRNVTVVVPDV